MMDAPQVIKVYPPNWAIRHTSDLRGVLLPLLPSLHQQAELVKKVFKISPELLSGGEGNEGDLLFFVTNGPGVIEETWSHVVRDGMDLSFERKAPKHVRDWWCAEGGFNVSLAGRTAPFSQQIAASIASRHIFNRRSASRDLEDSNERGSFPTSRRFDGESAQKLMLSALRGNENESTPSSNSRLRSMSLSPPNAKVINAPYQTSKDLSKDKSVKHTPEDARKDDRNSDTSEYASKDEYLSDGPDPVSRRRSLRGTPNNELMEGTLNNKLENTEDNTVNDSSPYDTRMTENLNKKQSEETFNRSITDKTITSSSIHVQPKYKFVPSFAEKVASEIKASQEALRTPLKKFESEFTRRLQNEIEESQAQAAILFDLQETLNDFFKAGNVQRKSKAVPSPIKIIDNHETTGVSTPLTPSRSTLLSLQQQLDSFFGSIPTSLTPARLSSLRSPRRNPLVKTPLPSPRQVARVKAGGLSIDLPKAYKDLTSGSMLRSPRHFSRGSPRSPMSMTSTITPTTRCGHEMIRKIQEDLNDLFATISAEPGSKTPTSMLSPNSLVLQVQNELDAFFSAATVVQTPKTATTSQNELPGDNAILIEIQKSLDTFFSSLPMSISKTAPSSPYSEASIAALNNVQEQLNAFFSSCVSAPEFGPSETNAIDEAQEVIYQIQDQLDDFFSEIREEVSSEPDEVQRDTEETIMDIKQRVDILMAEVNSSLSSKFEEDNEPVLKVDEQSAIVHVALVSSSVNNFAALAQSDEQGNSQIKQLEAPTAKDNMGDANARRYTPLDIDIPDDIRDMLSGSKPSKNSRNAIHYGSELRRGSLPDRDSTTNSISSDRAFSSDQFSPRSSETTIAPPPTPPQSSREASINLDLRDLKKPLGMVNVESPERRVSLIASGRTRSGTIGSMRGDQWDNDEREYYEYFTEDYDETDEHESVDEIVP